MFTNSKIYYLKSIHFDQLKLLKTLMNFKKGKSATNLIFPNVSQTKYYYLSIKTIIKLIGSL